MTRILALFALLTVACATPTGPANDSQVTVADTTDTASDSAVQVQGLQAVTREGACTQGQEVQVDLGTERPMALQVEVTHEEGQAELMAVDFATRTIALEYIDNQSPFYRDGTTFVFTCGYKLEGSPIIGGNPAGPAVSYRASWLVLL